MLTTSVTNYTHIPYTPPPGDCSIFCPFFSDFFRSTIGRLNIPATSSY